MTVPIGIACTTSDMPGRRSRLLLELWAAKALRLAISQMTELRIGVSSMRMNGPC